MSNGNELNQFLNAMPGWLIQLRQMKQRAQQVKSQQDIQREKLELDQQRALGVIGEAKTWQRLKAELEMRTRIADVIGRLTGEGGRDLGETLESKRLGETIRHHKEMEKVTPKEPTTDELEIIGDYSTLQSYVDRINSAFASKKTTSWLGTDKTADIKREKFDNIRSVVDEYYGHDPESRAKRMTWKQLKNKANIIRNKYPNYDFTQSIGSEAEGGLEQPPPVIEQPDVPNADPLGILTP